MNTSSPTPQLPTEPRVLLQRELERRCNSNPRYSLRAFARALGMSPAGLSYVLSGKRFLSRKSARRISNLLALPEEESMALAAWADSTPWRRHAALEFSVSNLGYVSNPYLMSLDSFAFVSEWFHYGILSLLEIQGARLEPKWVARHLGISEAEAKGAIERLKRMEIIEQIDGVWRQSKGPIRMASDTPTSATKKYQKQLLLKAVESMENDPDDVKDLSSMTLAMDPALIPYAKERIRNFRRQLAEELERKSKPTRVYEFTVQIFPVSRPIEEQNYEYA